MMMDFRSSMRPREIDRTKKGFTLRKLSLPLNMSSNREIESKVLINKGVFKKQLLEETAAHNWKSKKEIRKLLHPHIADSYLPEGPELVRWKNKDRSLGSRS